MSRISKKFKEAQKRKGKLLATFITAGDPSESMTEKLILAMEKGGADIIELGVPFSDPMADGPVIQKASERALAKGMTLKKVLQIVRNVRKKTQIPILLMGYYNPILAHGLRRYAADASKAGVDATLVVDLPPEESSDLDRELKKVGLDLIYLLAPTSDLERIRQVGSRARGFIYFVSITGITGARLKSEKEIQKKVTQIRTQTKVPIAIGFGITNADQAKKMSKIGDGIVIGSALVSLIQKNATSKQLPAKVESFTRRLKEAL